MLTAFAGMPGSGKSTIVGYAAKKGIPFIRFGQLVEDELQKKGLPINPDNEEKLRETLRQQYGMAIFAERALPHIQELFTNSTVVGIDGLYSWEEYLLLKKYYPDIILIAVFAEREVRYQRLSTRPVRPLTRAEAMERDIAEIEHLNKGGPIAIADYLIDNSKDMEGSYQQVDALLARLQIRTTA